MSRLTPEAFVRDHSAAGLRGGQGRSDEDAEVSAVGVTVTLRLLLAGFAAIALWLTIL